MRLISICILTYGSYEVGLRLSSFRFQFLKKAEAGDVLRDWGIPFLGEDVEEFEESSKDEFPYQYRLLLKVFFGELAGWVKIDRNRITPRIGGDPGKRKGSISVGYRLLFLWG